MQAVRLPTRIDEPQHLFLWSADEIVPIIMGLAVGMVMSRAFLGLLSGFFIAWLYRRFRDNHADGFIRHLAYHWGFNFTKAPSMLNPFIKRLFPW